MVGAMALGFEMRDVPHSIKHMMKGNIRRWYNIDQDEKKHKRSEKTPPRGDRAKQGLSNAAWAMGGETAGAGAGGAAASKWGQRPAGGWTLKQKQQWEEEEDHWEEDEKARKARDVRMHKRVERELKEIKRTPRVVSTNIEGASQRTGVSPDRDVVDKLAAKVIANRSQMGLKEGDSLFQDKAMKRWKSTKPESK
jgi:hypothetical protein